LTPPAVKLLLSPSSYLLRIKSRPSDLSIILEEEKRLGRGESPSSSLKGFRAPGYAVKLLSTSLRHFLCFGDSINWKWNLIWWIWE
jgi:hypothetical protein